MAEKSTMAQLDPEESSRDFQLETTLHEPAGNNEAMGTGPTNTGPTNADPMNTGPTNTGPANTGPTNTGPANQRLTHARPPVLLPDISQSRGSQSMVVSPTSMNGTQRTGSILKSYDQQSDDVFVKKKLEKYAVQENDGTQPDIGSLAEEMTLPVSVTSSAKGGRQQPDPGRTLHVPETRDKRRMDIPTVPKVPKLKNLDTVSTAGLTSISVPRTLPGGRTRKPRRKQKTIKTTRSEGDLRLPDLSARSYRTARTNRKHTTVSETIDERVRRNARYPAKFADHPERWHAYHNYYYYYSSNYIYSRYRLSRVIIKREQVGKMLKSEANYIRLCRMCIDVGIGLLRDVLQQYIDSLYPYTTLKEFLRANKKKMIGFASADKVIGTRWKQLYPDIEPETMNVTEFDAVLTFWMLRHMCRLKRSSDAIWRFKPDRQDVSKVADIVRIRDYRNFVLDIKDPALFDEEFTRKVDEFKEVVTRLLGRKGANERLEMLGALQKLEPETSEREACRKLLKAWAKESGDRHVQKIGPLNQAWDLLKECKDNTKRLMRILRHPKLFVRLKSYDTALKKLQENGIVVIKGNTGEGKTTTAVAMMSSLWDPDEVLWVQDTTTWRYVDTRTAGVIFMDDLFGSMYYEETRLKEWEPFFEQIYRCVLGSQKGKTARIILTIRNHVFDACAETLAKYKLFDPEHIVEFKSKDLNFSDMRLLLTKHILVDSKVRAEIYKSAKLHTCKLGFPQCCSLYVNHNKFHDVWSHFFEHPIEILHDELDALHKSNRVGYLALVLMMFQKGAMLKLKQLMQLDDEVFLRQFETLAGVCEVSDSAQLPELVVAALYNSLGSFVFFYEETGSFTFSHESVMEIMMSSFVKRYPQYVLEISELQFIVDYVFTQDVIDSSRDQIFVMHVTSQNFGLLAEAFSHYLLCGLVQTISTHRVFRHDEFVEFFFSYLSKRGDREKIILAVDAKVTESDGKRNVGVLLCAIDQKKPNALLVRAILSTGIHGQTTGEWVGSELISALSAAVSRGSHEIYLMLLEAGVKLQGVFMMDSKYLTCLPIVTDMIQRHRWSQEHKDVALVRAARNPEKTGTDVVKLLLANGASPNSIRAGTTALCEAVKIGNMKSIQLVLAENANRSSSVNERDMSEGTPLHHACDWGHLEVVEYLLKKDGDVNMTDENGFSPFLIAAGWGREDVMKALLTRPVNPLIVDNQKNNVLHICGATGREGIINMLLEKFPDEMQRLVMLRNSYGWTPIDFSYRCGHYKTTKVLVKQILKLSTPRSLHSLSDPQTFVHTRFSVVRKEFFNFQERNLCRFIDENSDMPIFRIPRCKWHIHSSGKDEFYKTTEYVNKHEEKLRWCLAKN